jgi:hypothetical protein
VQVVNQANLRLICKMAIAMTAEHLEFLRTRVADHDQRWTGTYSALVDVKQRVYTDFTFLRVKCVTDLPLEDWKVFLDRRWHQFAECGFSFVGTQAFPMDKEWKEYWTGRAESKPLAIHIALVKYTTFLASSVKQKLRVHADSATAVDKVCVVGACFFLSEFLNIAGLVGYVVMLATRKSPVQFSTLASTFVHVYASYALTPRKRTLLARRQRQRPRQRWQN